MNEQVNEVTPEVKVDLPKTNPTPNLTPGQEVKETKAPDEHAGHIL